MGKTNIQVDLIEFDKSLEDIERIKPEALSKYLKQKPKELKRDQGYRKVERLAGVTKFSGKESILIRNPTPLNRNE